MQFDQPGTLAETGQHLGRNLQRQPGLADTSHPRQRHHPRLAHAATVRSISRSRPMNELACNGRFPGNASTDVNAANCPTSPAHTPGTPAPHAKIVQPMLAQIGQCHALRDTVVRQVRRRLRAHHLTAVRDAHQPRRTFGGPK